MAHRRSAHRVAVLFASFLLLRGAPGADRRADPRLLRIATFNVRFLFDGVPPEGEASFPWKNNASAARAHLRDIAAILRRVDADLIHISEVEDLETLKRLTLEVGDPTYEAFLIPGRDGFTRQNVGLISRIDPDGPLIRSDDWAPRPGGGPAQGVPKNFAAAITAGRLRLTLVGAHLLAFPDDPERIPRREAQAEVLRRLAEDEGTRRGRLVIVLGDLNDFDPEVPGPREEPVVSQTLSIIRPVSHAEAGDDLMNPAILLPAERRFSAFVDRDMDGADGGLGERTLTDHILVPRVLEGAITSMEVIDSHDPLGPSDHFPLKLTLDLSRFELFLRGDADGDGSMRLPDAVAVLRHLFAGEPAPCEDAADADDDGRLTITDAVGIILHTAGLGPAPPPPGPTLPGLDGTADGLSCN